MPSPCLTPPELAAALQDLPRWRIVDGRLHREWKFADFRAAFAFMTRVALAAEAQDHHPEWWNSYATLRVWLWTHDAGGITAADVTLARAIDG